MYDRTEFYNNFITTLEKVRCDINLTQKDMAEKLGVSLSNYKKIITGDTKKLDLYIAYVVHCLTGKFLFEMISGDDLPLHNQVFRIVQKLRKLNPKQLNFIESIVDFEIDFSDFHKTNEGEHIISMLILTGDMEDGMIYDSTHVNKINIGNCNQIYKDVNFAVKVTSNHLTPAYVQGDILLVSKSPVRDGDVGIFINKETGRAYLRKYQMGPHVLLVPVNDFGVTFEVDPLNESDVSRWFKLGRVITKLRA